MRGAKKPPKKIQKVLDNKREISYISINNKKEKLMKTFKVETVTVAKRFGSVAVEAETEKEAIEKAKSIEWDDFDETETTNQCQWQAKTDWTFFKFLDSIFKG